MNCSTSKTNSIPKQAGLLTADDFKAASEWPTVAETAEMYGVRRRWLNEQIANRKFRVIRVNWLRVDPEDFRRFMNDLNEPD